MQRQELEQTRAELKGQKEQLTAQNETFRRENFENTFFSLLKLHNDVIATLEVPHQKTGRDCFRFYCEKFREVFVNPPHDPNDDLEYIGRTYQQFYVNWGGRLGHYFRLLYNIVKFVHHSDVSDKRFYTNLVRAQISDDEAVLLFYNCLSEKGSEKFKPLIETYALLKVVQNAHLLHPRHRQLYADSAFRRPTIEATAANT